MQVGRVLPRSLLLLVFLASFRIYTLSDVKKCSSIVSATFYWNDKVIFKYKEASNIVFALSIHVVRAAMLVSSVALLGAGRTFSIGSLPTTVIHQLHFN